MAFGERTVFESLSCGFRRGKISVILGGSGSGKSTILRLIGGLVQPQAGAIFVDGHNVVGLSERRMYEVRRKLGMMFQAGALLDSLSVFDNLAFPLREHTKLSETEIAAEVHDCLTAVGMSNVGDLLPGQLSGGMLKRAALARAIIRKPAILLCDEPFSGLDPASTKRIEQLLVRMNRDFGNTMLVVSHHIPSTMRMANHILLLLPHAPIEGSPEELRASADPRVTSFLTDEAGPADLAEEPDEPPAGRALHARGGRW
ncbi:MAG TPA: ATP-binding cassette domain-containing protein [Candidatus Binatia bacterium]|nr:ATP-binding cassette domain-containing protein [Candidatus Binatia bacterium]